MAKFKNVSPLGALDIPALGRVVEAGEVFEVPSDLAKHFAGQDAIFKPVKPAKPKVVAQASTDDAGAAGENKGAGE